MSELDFVREASALRASLVSGRGHYESVIEAVRSAEISVWIATANLKELMVEDHRLIPGRRRTRGRSGYRSIIEELGELAASGVEIRVLHASLPSRAFRRTFDRLPEEASQGIELRPCPRNHLKVVIVDGAFMYFGSANWTGAGLGAKGEGRRNFELGIVTDDEEWLDEVQSIYERIWRGGPCAGCRLQSECEMPIAELERLRAAG